MIATERRAAPEQQRSFEARPRTTPARQARMPSAPAAPIVAAVESQTVRVTAAAAARLARELRTSLVFVTVRPRPPAFLGEPYYQRRLTQELFRGRKTIDAALAEASRLGVMAWGEMVEGDIASRIVQLAADRDAPLLVVGRRRRRLGRSVSRRVIAAAGRPVVVASAASRSGRSHPRRPDRPPGRGRQPDPRSTERRFTGLGTRRKTSAETLPSIERRRGRDRPRRAPAPSAAGGALGPRALCLNRAAPDRTRGLHHPTPVEK